MNFQKLKYFAYSSLKLLSKRGLYCPSCGYNASSIISKKYLVTSLRRCHQCKLLFRCPTSSEKENVSYYQMDYQEGFTTEMPSAEQLERIKETKFFGTPKDFSRYIKVLRALNLPQGASILDFGCSWGYGSWQFSQNGFEVKAFEISKPRALYAREKLGVNVETEIEAIDGKFDVFFSAHVLEHVPSISNVINVGMNRLREGGYFIAFTPNGSLEYRKANRKSWQYAWGLKHPNHLDEVFYQTVFSSLHYYISSSPFNFQEINEWARDGGQRVTNRSGSELLLIARNK